MFAADTNVVVRVLVGDDPVQQNKMLARLRKIRADGGSAGGATLLDTATKFLDAGERIHLMLSDRADVPKGARKEAARLRSATVGMLGRLRADVAREVKKDEKLPRDLEARVFGYLDTLDAMHAPKVAPPAPPAAPPAPAAPEPKQGP